MRILDHKPDAHKATNRGICTARTCTWFLAAGLPHSVLSRKAVVPKIVRMDTIAFIETTLTKRMKNELHKMSKYLTRVDLGNRK